MNLLDLFSGIGGFSLGLERAGMKTIAFCEKDNFCQQVLRKHWHDIPIFNDIMALTKNDIKEKIDIITGGYPCQPFSVAGYRRGTEDNRYLWSEMFRLIVEIRPRWVIAENVTGHINLGLDKTISDLASEDYSVRVFVLPAVAVGGAHSRSRVWIVAHADQVGLQRFKKKGKADRNSEYTGQIQGFETERGRNGVSKQGRVDREIESCLCGSDDGLPGWLDGFKYLTDPDYSEYPRLTDRDDLRRKRIGALGNAVVPQIPELLGRAIMEIERC